MRIIAIPKKSGGKRLIYAPNRGEKQSLRRLLPALCEVWAAVDTGVAHGCVPFRSPVTAAIPHVGKLYTLTMDLKDFFDSVRVEHMPPEFDKINSHASVYTLFPDGAPRQGLPTSPMVANIAAAHTIDKSIQKVLSKFTAGTVVYTRYVDDMSFSFNDPLLIGWLRDEVKVLCKDCGFTINERKTRLQCAKFGNRQIVGVSVGQKGVSIPRRTRRRLRAAEHQGSAGAEGLREWCKCKSPSQSRSAKERSKKLTKHAQGFAQGFGEHIDSYLEEVRLYEEFLENERVKYSAKEQSVPPGPK